MSSELESAPTDDPSAIDFVNTREKPLALYVFTRRREVEDEVLARTSSGGVCVNATSWQLANPNMGFGGVGESGVGGYWGRAGFETFGHRKRVVEKGVRGDLRFAYPPHTRLKQTLVKRLA
jgi:aldehyde dehydrogenase (NAD+)